MTPFKKYKLSTIIFATLSIVFMVIIFFMSAQPVEKSSDMSDEFSLILLDFLEPDLQKEKEKTTESNTDTDNSKSETVVPEDTNQATPENPDATEDTTKNEDKTQIADKDEESVTASTKVPEKPKPKPTKNWFGVKPELFYAVIRKAAHFLLFMGLGMCLLLTFVSYHNKFDINQIILSVVLSFLYACSDEFHQIFVKGRGGSFDDIRIDFSGALFGIALICTVWIIGYLIKRFIKRLNKQKNA